MLSSSLLIMVSGLEVSLAAEFHVSDLKSDEGGSFVLKAVMTLSTKGLQYGLSIKILSATASST